MFRVAPTIAGYREATKTIKTVDGPVRPKTVRVTGNYVIGEIG